DKNEEGKVKVNSAGDYLAAQDIDVIGDPNPDYQLNWINTLSFKGFTFNMQWSYISGGDIYSITTATMMARGNTVDTEVDRFIPVVAPGVLASDGSPNNIQAYLGDVMFNAYFFADEGAVFDGTVLRMREISLAYELPSSILEKTPFGGISLQIAGENLFYNAPNFPYGVNFDPEVLSLGVGNGRGFDYITGPTAKKYGVSLNLTF
ncbi:MAG: SusC/RagA family TonB-linked outer membrane protein, partial [Bacteroidetes bacterium]|nr:SusC/RagA family TonB-linked outer membrane protein [Bacteroidota bacterium]